MYVLVISLIIMAIMVLAYYQLLANKRLDKVEFEINDIKMKNDFALKNIELTQERLEKDMKQFFEKNQEYNKIFQEKLEAIERYTKNN